MLHSLKKAVPRFSFVRNFCAHAPGGNIKLIGTRFELNEAKTDYGNENIKGNLLVNICDL